MGKTNILVSSELLESLLLPSLNAVITGISFDRGTLTATVTLDGDDVPDADQCGVQVTKQVLNTTLIPL